MRFKSIYCTYDSVAMMYGEGVFVAWNDDDAKRGFKQFLDSNDMVRPQDFSLIHLGTYDRVEGTISIKDLTGAPHRFVCSGIDVVPPGPTDNVLPFMEKKE